MRGGREGDGVKFLSVCSGIEAASVAWHPLGWRAWGLAEIEAFPSAVLAHHYPTVPNLGDMTKFKDWPDGSIDLLCGGTPCQSFSNAGLRAGLDDPRGQLMLTFGAIAARYRPRWLVWENVPGVLSSNGGRDFGAFLGLLGFLGYGFAYRVLDAQFVRVDGYGRAVPQRRQRVFVVGCLGDWRSAAAVLLERESLRGDSAPRRSAGAGIAPSLTVGSGGSSGHRYAQAGMEGSLIAGIDFQNVADTGGVCGTLMGESQRKGGQAGHGVLAYGGNQTSGPRAVASALSALSAHGGACGRMDFETETFVAHTAPVGVTLHGSDGTTSTASYSDTASCLRARAPGNRDNSTTTVVQHPVPFDTTQITSASNYSNPKAGDPCHPLAAGAHAPAVAFGWQNAAAQGMAVDTISPALDKSKTPATQHAAAVRRLMPVECERLMGFPDGYTLVPFRGKPAADGNRYKALGNSWAVNCARWIGWRISLVDSLASRCAVGVEA